MGGTTCSSWAVSFNYCSMRFGCATGSEKVWGSIEQTPTRRQASEGFVLLKNYIIVVLL